MGFLDNAGLAHVWEKVKTALSAKQDKLTGTEGQVVGFDAYGEAEAWNAVLSFNGRTGAVTPQNGDYTAEMVGAVAGSGVQTIQALTQEEYDALTAKDASTLYVIKE